jgi:hypothetical protein
MGDHAEPETLEVRASASSSPMCQIYSAHGTGKLIQIDTPSPAASAAPERARIYAPHGLARITFIRRKICYDFHRWAFGLEFCIFEYEGPTR